MERLPCILCGKQLDKRIDKNGKPYFVCNPCGIQVFIRGKRGRKRLERLLCSMNTCSISTSRRAKRT
jgi:DNA-directed RNA polymerase subunit RPC12/RpoP